MEPVKLKYIGQEPTLVRIERNGEKVEVNEGDVVEMESELAENLMKVYKNKWVSANKVPLKKQDMKVEGGLNEDKIEKGSKKVKKA